MQLGHNQLSSMLKDMLVAAGVDAVDKSNCSLRATGISRLFISGVPDKLIMERPGHISTKGVQVYERTTTEQKQHVSDVLSCVKTVNENSKPPGVKTEPGKEPQADAFGCQFIFRMLLVAHLTSL